MNISISFLKIIICSLIDLLKSDMYLKTYGAYKLIFIRIRLIIANQKVPRKFGCRR